MEITVLGSGSTGNCYRLSDGQTPLLLECGLPIKEIKQKLNFVLPDACLITHEHGDHAKSIKDIAKAGIDIYLTEGTRNALGITGHRIHIITPGKQFALGTWTILPFDTIHDTEEPVGFLLASGKEKVLFITDTMYCRYRFQGLTHLLLECNYADDIISANVAAGVLSVELKNRIIKSHFSLANVKEFLRANDLRQVQEICLIHLSSDNSDAGRFKREVQSLTGKPVYIA